MSFKRIVIRAYSVNLQQVRSGVDHSAILRRVCDFDRLVRLAQAKPRTDAEMFFNWPARLFTSVTLICLFAMVLPFPAQRQDLVEGLAALGGNGLGRIHVCQRH